MHHPSGKFELVEYKFVIETKSEGMYLDTMKACFEEFPLLNALTLPLQASEMDGKLMVAAKYGDGRLVFSRPHIVESMPQYGK